MLVIYAEKSSLAKTIAAVLGAGQRIPMQGEPTEHYNEYSELFGRLDKSEFRSKFKLDDKDIHVINEKGMGVIRLHAVDFVQKRLAPEVIPNDGKQTPMRGHPVFKAHHATACCCRGCLYKWHHIPAGVELTQEQQEYVVNVLMEWIWKNIRRNDMLIVRANTM